MQKHELTQEKSLWKELSESDQSQVSGGAKEQFTRKKTHANFNPILGF